MQWWSWLYIHNLQAYFMNIFAALCTSFNVCHSMMFCKLYNDVIIVSIK